MSDPRGRALQNALAGWLAAEGWPHAESAGAGRKGSDVTGTPGIVWECKTARNFKRDFRPQQWAAQSRAHANGSGDIPVTVYFPNGIGARSCGDTIAMIPARVLVRLLHEAGYGHEVTP
jgi:hypothetical protein